MNLNKELIYKNNDQEKEQKQENDLIRLKIVHFNDVYNIESRNIEPVGGASRFVTAINLIKSVDKDTIVLFSGDAYNPSMLSIILKGKQMTDVLNELQINAACIGNHDFDFGIDHLIDLTSSNNFPWILSNVLDAETEEPLANAKFKHIIEIKGLKIGIIGLAEEEWIATLCTIDFDEVIFEPFVDIGKKLAVELKTIEKCDLVIALTHMRMPNDEILALEVPEIDIILGGHDHDYNIKNIHNKFILKSGTDFREFSLIELIFNKKSKSSFVNKIERIIVDSTVAENEKIKNIVDNYMEVLQKQLEVTLGEINIDLDGRFIKLRTEETNLGNFMCDIVLEAVNADCVIINSGTFRSDSLHPKGEFKVRDLKAILPFLDTVIVIACTGKEIYEALENGVSQYPKLDGRFPQVAGLQFAFNPSKPSGKRIDWTKIKIQNEPLNLEMTYLVATKSFLRLGYDGYEMFKSCKVIVDEENGPQLITLIENHFKTIQQVRDHTSLLHRPSLVSLAQRNRLLFELSRKPSLTISDQQHLNHHHLAHQTHHHHHLSFHTAASLITRTLHDYHHVVQNLTHDDILHIKESDEYKTKMHEYEEKTMALKPVVEGRITRIIE